MVAEYATHGDEHEGELSAGEEAVLALVARGLTNREVATQLAISVHGVKFRLASAFRKLGVDNRTAAAVVYLRDFGARTD